MTNERGFSTLEIVTTILFLGIAIPALVNLFGYSYVSGVTHEVETRSVTLCKQKLEDIMADKLSPSRGYSWVTTAGRYGTETITGGYTRTVDVVASGRSFMGVPYAEVTVRVTHDLTSPVQLVVWLTQY